MHMYILMAAVFCNAFSTKEEIQKHLRWKSGLLVVLLVIKLQSDCHPWPLLAVNLFSMGLSWLATATHFYTSKLQELQLTYLLRRGNPISLFWKIGINSISVSNVKQLMR